ncbi:MAG: HAD family hydrolase [Chitinophagaceae bacterium]
MKKLIDYKVIFWDFDGVIMDSMPIRNKGFELVLSEYPKNEVDALMSYHKANGGLSRYAKFRYFFEVIKNESVTDEKIAVLANSFSEIMLQHLINPALLIADSVAYIQKNYIAQQMHIVSASDGVELNKICGGVYIQQYFKTIQGSPTPKKQLVNSIIQQFNYSLEDIVLIGDSANDYEASSVNKIDFLGYNNPSLAALAPYIEAFSSL